MTLKVDNVDVDTQLVVSGQDVKAKLDTIASNATSNDTDANLRARSSHTGTQAASTISDFNSAADARITAQKAAASGLATLGADSKIPTSQLPALAITDTFVVANQAAMLALTAETGDVAVRTDLNKTFILLGANPATLAHWQEMLTPTDAVLSVNGQTGAVSLTHAQLASGVGTNTHAQIDTHLGSTAEHGATGAVVGTTNTQTLTNKTLTAPTISDLTNMNHTHAGATAGGQIAHTALTSIGTNTHAQIDTHIAATAEHGATGAVVGTTNTQTLTNKTLTTPTIVAAGFTNMQHTHAGATTGGQIAHTALTSIGTNTHAQIDTHIAATAAHGVAGAIVGTTDAQTLTNKTLTAPTIASMTNAQHTHADAAGGGLLPTAAPPTVGTANAAGTATSYSRSDHVHNHGDQTVATHHAVATTGANGFMSSTDKTTLDGLNGVLTTRGDLLTRDASARVRLPIGATGKFLTSNGTDPVWTTVTASKVPNESVVLGSLQSTTSTTFVDIPGLELTLTLGATTNAVCRMFATVSKTGGGNLDGEFRIYKSSGTPTYGIPMMIRIAGSSDLQSLAVGYATADLAPGMHTFRAQYRIVTGSTALQVEEASMAVQGMEAGLGPVGPAGTNGAPGDIVWKGAWVDQDYVLKDTVQYLGSSYTCKLSTTSKQIPTNTTYWDLVAQKGEATTRPLLALRCSSAVDISAGATAIPFQVQTKVDSAYSHTVSTSDITINTTGWYDITYWAVTASTSTTVRSESSMYLEVDTGGGFAEMVGTRSYNYNRQTSEGKNTASVTVIRNLTAGNKIRLMGIRTSGTDAINTVADAVAINMREATTAGPQGATGATGLLWQGNWVSQNYTVSQAVHYNGSSYICKLNTTTSQVPTNTTYWDPLVVQNSNLIYRSTATQANTLITHVDLTELTSVSLPTGTYSYDCNLVFRSAAIGTGVGFRFNASTVGGATVSPMNGFWQIQQAAPGTAAVYSYFQIDNANNNFSASVVSTTVDNLATGRGTFTVTGAGAVAIQMRSEVAASAVTLQANSTFFIRKLT